jgi:glyoxylase I family protein
MPDLVFHHIALACPDPLAVERFYTRFFGFRRARVVPTGPDSQIVFLKAGNAYLELFPAREPAPFPVTADGPWYPAFRHLAFKVANVDAKLVEMGAEAQVTLGPFSFDEVIPGWRTVWVADPAGNIVEISQGYVDQENPPQPDGVRSDSALGRA